MNLVSQTVWTLQTIPIKELKPYPKNPRQISKDQFEHLTSMIAKFGMIDKPIINLDRQVIGGHQRIKILKKMKVKEVECWVPDRQLAEEEIDQLCIGLNLNQGTWDWDILANQWDELDLLRWGFTEEQLIGISKEIETEEVAAEEEKKKSLKKCPECGHEF